MLIVVVVESCIDTIDDRFLNELEIQRIDRLSLLADENLDLGTSRSGPASDITEDKCGVHKDSGHLACWVAIESTSQVS
jgi:hypothetical protein